MLSQERHDDRTSDRRDPRRDDRGTDRKLDDRNNARRDAKRQPNMSPQRKSGGRDGYQGDQSMPPDAPSTSKVRSSASSNVSAIDMVKKMLYDPPVSLEQLALKLKLSLVSSDPLLTKLAFSQR
jgi:hypothetical protein